MKEKVYLDYNIFVNYINKVETYNILDDLKNRYTFFYSPAYLEEVANINHVNQQEETSKYLSFIDILFERNIFLPVKNGNIIAYKESAKEPFERVIKYLDATKIAEYLEYQQMDIFKLLQKKFLFESKVISNLTSDQIFYDDKVQDFLDFININRSTSDFIIYNSPEKNAYSYLSNHRKTEQLISILFNVLESVGYKGEQIKKTVSRLHDVSHAIYATKADIFVTNDVRFATKCQAVYEYAGVPTKVLSYEEFLHL